MPNPGVEATLEDIVPQGFDPKILMLELKHKQKPGMWTQVITSREVRYEKPGADYDQVHLFHDGQGIALLDVEDVH